MDQENNKLQQYLQKHLGLKIKDAKKIKLLKAKNLPAPYQAQLAAFDDKRLENITIAVVPDNLWIKGNLPSESSAEKLLILIKKNYFEAKKNPDEIAWVLHELAHCQNFLISESAKIYQKNMRTFAFEELKTKHLYPNNLVEKFAFSKQFHYLKKKGESKKNILTLLKQYYSKKDFPFFDKLLGNI